MTVISPYLTTVLGPVGVETLGFIDAHSHVWINPVQGSDPAAPVLADEDLLKVALAGYAEAGGSAIVDCQPGGCGRDANKLVELSRQTGIHIVACTGFHRRRYYPSDAPIWQMTAEQACDHFVSEIRQGVMETRDDEQPVYAGFIKIAAELSLDRSPIPLFEAAAEASRRTGLAIEMHTEQGAAVEPILSLFLDLGVLPERLVFCHMDKRPDFGLHRDLAKAGVLLEYDTFFRPKYDPDHNAWPLLMRMLEAGLGSQLALASDMAEPHMWKDVGPARFTTVIRERLERSGTEESLQKQLMGGNIATRLSLH